MQRYTSISYINGARHLVAVVGTIPAPYLHLQVIISHLNTRHHPWNIPVPIPQVIQWLDLSDRVPLRVVPAMATRCHSPSFRQDNFNDDPSMSIIMINRWTLVLWYITYSRRLKIRNATDVHHIVSYTEIIPHYAIKICIQVVAMATAGIILGVGLANERRRYKCNVVSHWLSPCPEWSLDRE